jgi:1-acyl-sn-glycerol-3-phosphate acyltransferase
VKIGLFFTLKKISVYGKENIPKKGAILFIGNHQNALLDAILIPTTNSRITHFLARASAFNCKITSILLKSLNMIPVYRIKDGVNTIEKNFKIFELCFEILKNKRALEIFAEGEHHLDRRILPLKKGFARIILGTLKKYPDLDIKIVPVGINYDSHLNFPSSVSIYYGKPIYANPFFNLNNPDTRFSEIIKHVSAALKKLTLHIEDHNNYAAIIQKLENNNIDYLNPLTANEMLYNIDKLPLKSATEKSKINWFSLMHFFAKINSVLPLLIWRYLKSNIKEIIFTNTFRFAVITTLFPLFYVIQAGIIYSIFNLKYALIYLVACVFLGILATKTMTVNQ